MSNTSVEYSETSESTETVPEVGAETSGVESEQEAAGAHTPVSYSIPSIGESDGGEAGNGEASGSEFSIGFGPFSFSTEAGEESDESQFEAVEGFDEASMTEAAGEEADAEAVVDAWHGSATEAEQQEFFQFLAPLLLPVLKTALPAVASAAASNLPSALRGILQNLGTRRRRRVVRREAGEEGGLDEASLEAFSQQLEMIIDRDDRFQITNTTAVPWKRICHLQIIAANGKKFLGSGALIGPRTVVTAGHCVFMKQQGGWASSIAVTPGRNGNSKPFGSCNAVKLWSVRGWVNDSGRPYDYGAIILPSSFRLANPSAFGFANLSDAQLQGKKLNTAGYPGDKAPGTMWWAGRVATRLTRTTLVYNTATMGGQSGSAVWIKRPNGERIMVGIHTNGAPTGNSATRITAPVLANLKRWRQETMVAAQQPPRPRRQPGIQVAAEEYQPA